MVCPLGVRALTEGLLVVSRRLSARSAGRPQGGTKGWEVLDSQTSPSMGVVQDDGIELGALCRAWAQHSTSLLHSSLTACFDHILCAAAAAVSTPRERNVSPCCGCMHTALYQQGM